MVLGDVEETITVVDVNDETMEEVIRVSKVHFLRQQGMAFNPLEEMRRRFFR